VRPCHPSPVARGHHTHMFWAENRGAVLAFLDRFSGRPARDTLDTVEILDPARLRCTPSGQVRVDLPGRSLPEVIRDDWRARRRAPGPGLAALYRGGADPGIGAWPL